jgi:nucleoside-diphosphate-sugar epimerase
MRVRMLVRSAGRASHLAEAGAELVHGDMHTSRALEELVQDCDALVHAAGVVRGNNPQAFLHANLHGTRLLLDAIECQGVAPRLLLLSSLAAREPHLSWYAQSKREAENLVTASALDWVVLRPPAVYGPGDEEMKAIFDWMARGTALVPGRTEARMSLIHVDDLVRAILACLDSEAATAQVLELGDPKTGGYDWRELATIASTAYGRPVRLLPLPGSILDAVATLNLWVAQLTNRPAMLTPPKLRELRHENWVCDNAAITEATGWLPHIPLHDGLLMLREAEL